MDRRSLGRGSRLGPAAPPPAPPPPTTPFRADAFALALPPGWRDASIVTLAGPVVDGQPHQVTVVAEVHDERSLDHLADDQVEAVQRTLPGGAVLLRDRTALDSGAPAERVVFRWSPVPDRVLYQQQMYAVLDGLAVTMAASFTARSRRLVGPEVDRMMRSLASPPASRPAPPRQAEPSRPGTLRPRLGR